MEDGLAAGVQYVGMSRRRVSPQTCSKSKASASVQHDPAHGSMIEWTCQHVYDWLSTIEDLDEGITVTARSNKVDGRYSHLLHSAFA